MQQKALDSWLVGALPLFVRQQAIITAALLGFYLNLSHSQEKPLLDTAFLEVSVCPVYRAVVFRLAALWLVTHGSWTDRGHLLPPWACPCIRVLCQPRQSVMGSLWPVTPALEHPDGAL